MDVFINTDSVGSQSSYFNEADVGALQEQNVNDSLQTSSENSNVSEKCIFCDKERKCFKSRWQNLHVCVTEDSLQSVAEELHDSNLLTKINDIREREGIIFYHNICRKNYEYQLQSQIDANKPKGKWHILRDIHKIAYEQVCCYIREHVIEKKNCFFLNFFLKLYVENLKETSETSSADDLCINFEANFHLEEKLLQTFPTEITIVTLKKKKIVKPYVRVLLNNEDFHGLEESDILHKAALILRNKIHAISQELLPNELKTKDLIKGECELPTSLIRFYDTILSGPSYRRKNSENSRRYSKSFSSDLIYAVTNGRLKTSKTLGLAIKGLTNSKKIINILNKYGHCCGYTVLEELETEATFASSNRFEICPEDISRTTNLCTGLAFNNFDRFVDTPSGKDTLHDTVGIIYQNIDNTAQNDSIIRENIVSDDRPEGSKKRRRTFDAVTCDLESYAKKPRLIESLNIFVSDIPNNLESLKEINFVWILSHLLQIENTPMWVGYNSLIYQDNTCMQKVSYLTTINASPTSTSVVIETLKQSQKVAEECGETYMQVTYDLAIAKIALQLQCTEKPRFDNLFIHVGTFHVMMAYFKAIGKFIDNSGIQNIMINSDLLASGSLNGFIEGKHFNRCKRLHPIISVAIQILHFERFSNDENIELNDEVNIFLKAFKNKRSHYPTIDHSDVKQLFNKYEKYKQETMNGDHGKTPQYFMIYVQLIDYCFMLNTAIRTSNLELFQYVLPKITNLFLHSISQIILGI